ncbi:hypothetical protein JCM14202_2725 [Agrilactobacillus composti DSM 18527 = JCM 14202]|uniref:DUF4811 domain-containing protein n=1 Tax=Agrilactobacillus composti TaxID=398555 RepID=UPI00042E089C|nr:DUF4811 domain-containing protein [Agrilactobacillus composti]GAF40817.1 hypothetical protein JCM14202_2725 [Agrilactobacillus composti DSM 18527 = JCM 14202]
MLIIISLLCLVGIIGLAVSTKFKHRLGIGAVLTIVLLLAQTLLLLDTHTHWGTNLQTTQSQQTIASLVSFPGDNQVLAYRNVGSGKTRKQIYIYKPSSRSNKKLMTYADKVTILLERSPQATAHRIKAVTRYHYHNTWLKYYTPAS